MYSEKQSEKREGYIIFRNQTTIPHCYFHIHGSVLYSHSTDFFSFSFHISPKEASRARKGIGNSSSQPLSSGATYDNNYMITGYDKDLKLNKEPHSSILKSFFLDSYNSKEIIICGYSFLDAHVNSTLKYATNFTKSIHIIDFQTTFVEQQTFIANALTTLFEGVKKSEADLFYHNKLPNLLSGSTKSKLEFELCDIHFEFYFKGFMEFVKNELVKI
ncbi:MAG TPA: hypothetical protein VIJ57_03905 [Hanamia sp.]